MAQKVGIVLAGGAGRRFGREKAGVVFDGATLAQRAGALLWPHCGSVLVSLAEGMENPAPDWPAVVDAPPSGRGPLAGLAAAFAATGEADLLVLACDYPGVGAALMGALASQTHDDVELVMPVDPAGRDHPLVASWSRRMQPLVTHALEQRRYRVHALFADCRVRRLPAAELPVQDPEAELHNLNWPTDLARYVEG